MPLAPGTCYSAMPRNGKLDVRGPSSTEVKEDVKNAYNYTRANERNFMSQGHSLINIDVTVQIKTLLEVQTHKGIGSAVLVGIVSSIVQRNLRAALGVISAHRDRSIDPLS